MPKLFEPLALRRVTFRNRVFVSPMCMYSSREGLPNDWHMVHLGSRAVGGAGLVIAEATAVSPIGRITPYDTGLWSTAHAEAFAPIVRFIKANGAVAGIQLAHAGRKASTDAPWRGGKLLDELTGGWTPLAPSPVKFDESYAEPREITPHDLEEILEQFVRAARLAVDAGFQVIELHAAHGYLLHEFLSPLSNFREDEYGGDLENRMRFPLQVAHAVRDTVPPDLPVFVRISATDWAEGGWDLEQSVVFARRLKEIGIDLVDCSSGGLVPHAKVEVGPAYQAPFARRIREEVGIATGAVGMINAPEQANELIENGTADAILIARAMLRDPYWALHAAKVLGQPIDWPPQYQRAAD